jgi:glutamate dehydrogenase/leucine dehydrogenase
MTKNEISQKNLEIGPLKVIELFFPVSGFRAFVVVDNTALGPAVGGVRVSLNVTLDEVKRLARTMTMKNSIAGLPHGGGKAAIVADPKDPKKEHYFRIFSQAIKNVEDYIAGPDMGSNEECMAWIKDETGRVAGLPEEIGGLPLDKLGSTGYGLSECAEIACPYANVELKGAKAAIHGFGSVGKAAAKFFSEKGAVIVAVSDTKGAICNADGLDIKELMNIKEETGSVVNYKKGTVKKTEEIFSSECDILIPAATPDVITKDNVEGVTAKLIIQGANMPVTKEAEDILHKKAVLAVPDFIANAGGVITAAMEYAGKSEKEAFQAISERIKKNTRLILEKSLNEKILPRQAAESLAMERVLKAMTYQRAL